MTDDPLDARSDDGFYAQRSVVYATLYITLREVARKHGYAIALHGSLRKDLDVIAVPWVEDAAPESELVEAICTAVGGWAHGPDVVPPLVDSPRPKPHGRVAYTVMVGNVGYVDLCVMPRVPA